MEQDYGKAFRITRAAFGLKQADLAARLPITASQLSLIEAGKRQPSVKVVDALAKALGIPTAMITLLATSPDDVESYGDVSHLASALLKLLVAAKSEEEAEAS
jgi:transcriptional regulator with XRE-family HTH domain